MINEVLVVYALENPQLVSDVPQRLMVVGLKRDFLHGHDVARLVVDRRVDLAEVTLAYNKTIIAIAKPKFHLLLTDLVASLPREVNCLGLDVYLVLPSGLVHDTANGPLILLALLAVPLKALHALSHSLTPWQVG